MSAFQEQPLPTTVSTVADLSTVRAITGDGNVVSTTGRTTPGDNGAASYVYHRSGRSGISTDGGAFVVGPGVDDYWEVTKKDRLDFSIYGVDKTGATNIRVWLQSADNVPGETLLVAEGTYLIDNDITLTRRVEFDNDAVFKIGNGVTVTFSAGYVASPTQKVFDLSLGGEVVAANVDFVTADHLGASPLLANNVDFFEKAIDTAIASGVPLFVPSQEYDFTSSLVISVAGLNIQGSESSKSILRFTTGILDFQASSNIKIDNVTVYGNDAAYGGLYFRNGTSDVRVTNCIFKGWGTTGANNNSIIVCEYVDNCNVSNNLFVDNFGDDNAFDVIFIECKDIICTGNQCLSSNGYGIGVDNYTENIDMRFVIANNIVRGKGKHGMIIGYSNDILRGVISGNSVYNCDVTGMYVQVSTELDTGKVAITGNIFTYCGGILNNDDAGNASVYLSGTGGTFVGNIIEKSGYWPDREFTVDTATDEIIYTDHGLINDKPITFKAVGPAPGNALPAGLSEGTTYYVVEKTDNRFKVSLTVGGAAVNITGAGSGGFVFSSYRGYGRGRGIQFGYANDWVVSGNNIIDCLLHSIDFSVNYRQQNILVTSNIFTDCAEQMIGLYYAAGSEKSVTFAHNVFQMTNTDNDIIRVFDGVDQNGMRLVFRDNEFIGRKAGTGNAAFVFFYDRFGQTIIEGNIFRNLDKAYRFINAIATDNDWAWGEVVRTDRNTYESVTTVYDLQPTTYCAVGTENQYINCEPGFSRYIVPAKIVNGIMTGYYVDALPDRQCRENDRLLSLTPLTTDFLEWHQTATLPAAKSFTVGAGDVATNTFNCATVAFTVDTGTDEIISVAHGLVYGNTVQFIGGDLPDGLVQGTTYYVASTTDDRFKVTTLLGSAGPNILDAGSGTIVYQTPVLKAMDKIRFAGGSLPTPIIAGKDYYVATIPAVGTFKVANHVTAEPLDITSSGSGTFQKRHVIASWKSDIYSWLLRKPDCLNRWSGDGDSPNDYQGVENMVWTGTPAYAAAPTGKGGGKAFEFNGTNNYMTATIPAYTTSDAFTITCWLNKVALAQDSVLFNNQDALDNGWQLAVGSPDGNLYLSAGTLGNLSFTPAPVVIPGEWVFISLVVNGADSGLYVNATRRTTFTMDWDGPVPDHLQIGARAFNSTFFLDGKLSDVRLYSKALTLSQLLGLYNGPSFGY